MLKRTSLFALGAVASTAIVGGLVITLASQPSPAQAASNKISYKEDVYPIFKGYCVDCHQPGGMGYSQSGLDLSTYKGLMKGTKFGPMVIPGKPQLSSLMRLLDWQVSPQIRMPHGKKQLCLCLRNTIRNWIAQGAKDN